MLKIENIPNYPRGLIIIIITLLLLMIIMMIMVMMFRLLLLLLGAGWVSGQKRVQGDISEQKISQVCRDIVIYDDDHMSSSNLSS